jgi:hypothetical protein
VTQGEVAWLAAFLKRDGRLTENERLLVAFLKRESPEVHPSLADVVNRLAAAA